MLDMLWELNFKFGVSFSLAFINKLLNTTLKYKEHALTMHKFGVGNISMLYIYTKKTSLLCSLKLHSFD